MGWVFVHRLGESRSIYAHLQEPAPAGYYNQGDVIGICGSSGSWSTGPHVHFEHNQPYRCVYHRIHLKGGKTIDFDNYEVMRYHWYQGRDLAVSVEILDDTSGKGF